MIRNRGVLGYKKSKPGGRVAGERGNSAGWVGDETRRDRDGWFRVRTQGPRGLGLGSRNLATHPTNLALGGRPAVPSVRRFSLPLLSKALGMPILGLGVCYSQLPALRHCPAMPYKVSFFPVLLRFQRGWPGNLCRWVGFYKGDCKNATKGR
jgi:hypothetical protein